MITCALCRHPNPDDYRYCGRCGGFVGRTCATCGFPGRIADRFCGGCGREPGVVAEAPDPPRATGASAPVAPRPAPARPSADGEAAAPDGQRRQATIVFSDLSGYTAMNERLDPEDVADLMGRIKAAAVEIMEQHGGLVNQFVGDEVVTLFGIPTAREGDAVRAVRATLSLHRRVKQIGAAWRARVGRSITMHSGINTGLIVTNNRDIRDGRMGLTGDAVNSGARLLSKADTDEVLLSSTTHRLVERFFECEALAPVVMKGKALPMVPYRVIAERANPVELERPFVGREAEVARVGEAIGAALDAGRGRVVVLRGPAGLGKTRLMERCAEQAVALGFSRHTGWLLDMAQGSIGDAVAAVVGDMLDAGPELAEDARRQAARSALGLDGPAGAEAAFGEQHLACLCHLLQIALDPDLRALFEALSPAERRVERDRVLSGLAGRLATERPRLVLVEDLHWADGQALVDLASLARATVDHPIVMLITCRPEGEPVDAFPGVDALEIELAPFGGQEAADLVALYPDLEPDRARMCIERAAGNPMFLQELLVQAALGEEALPASVATLALSRIDDLPPLDRQAVRGASVIGLRPPIELVRWLIDVPDYDCGLLIEGRLLSEKGGRLAFAHALMRDGVYQSMLRSERRTLHARIARWYAERDPEVSADHYARADHPEAAPAYLNAARHAAGRLRIERAIELAERGLARDPEAGVAERLRCVRAKARYELGQVEDAIAEFRAVAAQTVDPKVRLLTIFGLADGLRVQGRARDALAELEAADALAVDVGSRHDLARLHFLRGNLVFPLGQGERCLAEHSVALAHARAAGSIALEVQCLGGLADGHYVLGDMSDAQGYFEQCVERAREGGQHRVEAANLAMIAHSAMYVGDIERADEAAQRSVELALKLRHHRAELVAHSYLMTVASDRGDVAATDASIERIGALQGILDVGLWTALAMGTRWRARFYAGESAGLVEGFDEALATARATGMGFAGPVLLGQTVECSPDDERRAAALAEGLALLDAGTMGHNHYLFHGCSIRGALLRGEWARATMLADRLAAYAGERVMPRMTWLVDAARLCAVAADESPDRERAADARRLIEETRDVDAALLPALRAAERRLTG